MSSTPPVIFATARREAARRRMLSVRRTSADAARYLVDDMAEDIVERLSFVRHQPRRALVVGDAGGELADNLRGMGAEVIEAEPAHGFAEDRPLPFGGFDLIASLSTLDTVNDLPGALLHMRAALCAGGLMIASFCGAGSLPVLRSAMLAADGDRPAPRLHPMVDVRAGGQLLQRTGYADPVVDSRPLDVSFRSLDGLVRDLRAQALGNVLLRHSAPLDRRQLAAARSHFAQAGSEGRTVERFEILTLSGWRR